MMVMVNKLVLISKSLELLFFQALLTEIEKWKKQSNRNVSLLATKDEKFSKEQLTKGETISEFQNDDIKVLVFESNI